MWKPVGFQTDHSVKTMRFCQNTLNLRTKRKLQRSVGRHTQNESGKIWSEGQNRTIWGPVLHITFSRIILAEDKRNVARFSRAPTELSDLPQKHGRFENKFRQNTPRNTWTQWCSSIEVVSPSKPWQKTWVGYKGKLTVSWGSGWSTHNSNLRLIYELSASCGCWTETESPSTQNWAIHQMRIWWSQTSGQILLCYGFTWPVILSSLLLIRYFHGNFSTERTLLFSCTHSFFREEPFCTNGPGKKKTRWINGWQRWKHIWGSATTEIINVWTPPHTASV